MMWQDRAAPARAFYEGTLGLTPSHLFGDETTGWVNFDIDHGTLSIGNGAPAWKPSRGGGCAGLEVEDFAAPVKRLREVGLKIDEQFDTPVCHMALIADPDGNSLMIHKRKAS